MPERFADRRAVVMGLGRFGGGAGVARWLAAHGARVLVTDLLPPEALRPSLSHLAGDVERGAVELRLGEHRPEDFETADLVVVNPAVPHPWSNPLLGAARRAGVTLTTEMALLLERLPTRRLAAVTGTAGKSTTAAMIHHALATVGCRAHLGGNIGGSLLGSLGEITADDWVVLELSSAMLHWLGLDPWPGPRPQVAVVTTFAPNHLDWHGSPEHYRTSKEVLLRAIDGDEGVAILGADLAGWAPIAPGPTILDARDPIEGLDLRVPGAHNADNARLALHAVGACLGDRAADAASIAPRAALLREFPGLPHRLELVDRLRGASFINDSKSTTPQATRRAVEAFPEPARVRLIAGGYDKGVDLFPIAELAGRLAGLYTVGATGPRLHELAAAHRAEAESCGSLETALARITAELKPGDVVLLSPGCASWDQFDNYEARGEAFRALVEKLAGTGESQSRKVGKVTKSSGTHPPATS